MPIYVYRCDCGLRFERLQAFSAAPPDCPACGGATSKIPAGFSLGGQAGAGLGKEQMPQTWRGLYNGSREYVTQMQRSWEKRQKLEARHPELAGDQRPIIAHEGRYHDTPLRAGDARGGAPGNEHGHGHGSGVGSAAPPPAASGDAPAERSSGPVAPPTKAVPPTTGSPTKAVPPASSGSS